MTTPASDAPPAAEPTTPNPAPGTPAAGPTTPDQTPGTRSRWERVASVVSGIVLTLLNLVTSIPIGLALLMRQPTGPGDTDVLDSLALLSTCGLGLALVSLVFTGSVTSVGWLGRGWLLLPATLLTAALIRSHAVPYP